MRLIAERVGCNEFAQELRVASEWLPVGSLHIWVLRVTAFNKMMELLLWVFGHRVATAVQTWLSSS